jgi:hypothetical protein
LPRGSLAACWLLIEAMTSISAIKDERTRMAASSHIRLLLRNSIRPYNISVETVFAISRASGYHDFVVAIGALTLVGLWTVP